MARLATHRALVAETLARVIQRADELSEFVAIYWAEGRQPLSAQAKKGLAAAFCKFDEYALAKYDRTGAVRLRDVLFLSHARPVDEVTGCTVEAAGSERTCNSRYLGGCAFDKRVAQERNGGADKRKAWERLLADRKLGALALLRNLRNLHAEACDEQMVLSALEAMKTDRVFRFAFWQQHARTAVGAGS